MTRSFFFTALAVALVALSLWKLNENSSGLDVAQTRVGALPLTVFKKRNAPPAPAIVIAHGFSGSQQLMQPMARTLAQNGYVAVTFDFSGHGRNQSPMRGGLADPGKSAEALGADIDAAVRFARALPGVDGRLALAGHSMATDLIVRRALNDQSVSAVAALSFFARDVTTTNPKNLLIVDGAWESGRLIAAGARVVSEAAGAPAQPGVTYGDLADGTGRRLALASGAEHVGVLYSRDALAETLDWMNAVFGRDQSGFIDASGRWIILLLIGVIALARPAAGLLPVASASPLGAGLPWRRLAPIAIAPALLTPLLLWKAPTDFLPMLLGDYLAVHFGVYGLLTGLGLRLDHAAFLRSRRNVESANESTQAERMAVAPGAPASLWPIVAGACALAAFYALGLGLPIDAYVTAFFPTPARQPLLLALFFGCALYFLADEWLTRGAGAARGGYAVTKLCFVVSLAIAVALNPRRLFFLVIIAAEIIILFAVYGLINGWAYARTKDPRVGALGGAFGLAWAIAVTFPIIG